MSYQKLFNNYFSTYGSQTGGAAVPAPAKPTEQVLAAPQQQLTQERLNQYLKNQGMDNTPAVKPQEEMKSLSVEAILNKSKESGWRRTPERSQKLSAFSKDAVMAQGIQGTVKQNVGQIASQVAQANKTPGAQILKNVPKPNYNPAQTIVGTSGNVIKKKLAASTGKPQRTLKEMSGQY